jgi:hypothetical protein
VIAAHFLLVFARVSLMPARAPYFGLARTLFGGRRAFSGALKGAWARHLKGAWARHLKGAWARLAIAGPAVGALTENDLHAA